MNELPAYSGYVHEAVDMVTAVSFGGSAAFTWPAGVIGGDSAGWSWAGWFWANALADRNLFLANETNAPTVGYTTTGTVRLQQAGGTWLASTGTFKARNWVHAACTVVPLSGNVGYDWVIYINGEIAGSGRQATGAFIVHATAPAGGVGSASRISRQTWWRSGITQAQVRAHYYAGSSGGAALNWNMTDSIGAVAEDSITGLAANRMGITLGSGGFWTSDTPKRGVMVQRDFASLLMPGVSGSNVVAAANTPLPNLVGATEITIAAWTKPRTGGNILIARSGASPTLRLTLATGTTSGGGSASFVEGETLRQVTSQQPSGNPIPLRGQWRQQAITFRPTADQIDYLINGALISRSTLDFNGGAFALTPAIANKMTIGEDLDGTASPFDGWIGPITVFDSPLTLAQLRSLYLTGNAGVQPAYGLNWTEKVGTAAASTGGKYALALTLQGTTAWSNEQPW